MGISSQGVGEAFSSAEVPSLKKLGIVRGSPANICKKTDIPASE